LSADSAVFARYWDLRESASAQSADSYLVSLSSHESSRLAVRANFLRAYLSAESGDLQAVAPLISRGFSPELADHAALLKSRALVEAGWPWQAEADLRLLAGNAESVCQSEAALMLANYWSETGAYKEIIQLPLPGGSGESVPETRRALKLMQAFAHSALFQHVDAVNLLWQICTTAPNSEEGQRARRALRDYQSTYGVTPRAELSDEMETELAAYAHVNSPAAGLARVRECASLTTEQRLAESVRYHEGLFLAQQKKYRDAIVAFKDYVNSYPNGRFLAAALSQLGRSAYLIGEDSLAISMLGRLEHCQDDNASICAGLETLTILHMDRGRPEAAVAAAQAWLSAAQSTGARADALWRLGWADWESHAYAAAASAWKTLSECQDDSEYGPASRYWFARALVKSGDSAQARAVLAELHARYTNSYYAVISSENAQFSSPAPRDLRPITLDELYASGKPHAQKFALLATVHVTDAALLEWPAVKAELSLGDDWSWWKAQLLLWQGNRMLAYRIVRNELGEYIRASGARPPEFNRIVYPLDYDPWIVDYCAEHALDPYFVCGLICQESHYESGIVSPAGAIGLMQLMPTTARTQARKSAIPFAADDLFEPRANLQIGISHIAELMTEFGGDTSLVLAAYNAGKSASQSWFEEFGDSDPDVFIEKIPYRETRLFVKRIVEHTAAYRRLYPELARVVPASKQLNELKP
jgi:soluble lytic murein transglycosylase